MTAISLRPGSFPWLLAHDMRLGWRGAATMFGSAGRLTMLAVVLAGGAVLHLLAWPAVTWLSPQLYGSTPILVPLVTLIGCAFAWMLAQSLFSASRTLYVRGDLDLLLASPVNARHVFAAKTAGIAAGSLGSVSLLVLPIANVGAVIDRPGWLGIYPALIGLTLIATAIGMMLTLAIFRMVGPARARLWTSMTGAVIAGSFVLGAQIVAMLPSRMRDAIVRQLEAVLASQFEGPLWLLALPVEAVRGDMAAAALLMAIGVALFTAAAALLGRGFMSASLAAAGASTAGNRSRSNGRPVRFRSGHAANLRRKEWRLLVRDPGMFAQLALQIIYTVPVAVVLLRNESLPPVLALAPTIVVIAAQVAASLAWIAVSGEDAPELIATAPVSSTAVDRAKLNSVALPVMVVLALPIAGLALVSWCAALMTACAAGAAAVSTALLNLWHPMPGNRRGMLRRHSQSKLIALIEHVLALMWAVAAVLALLGLWLAVIPVAVVVGILALVRSKSAPA